MKIVLCVLMWIIIDTIRYIRYTMMYNKLNNYDRKKVGQSVNHANIKKYLNDLKTYPELMEDNLKDIYYGRLELEDTSFEDVCDSIYGLCGESQEYVNEIKTIIKSYQLKEKRERDRSLFKKAYLSLGHRINKTTTLKSCFLILPLHLIIRCFNKLTQILKIFMGYKHMIMKNGLKIWYSECEKSKGTPIIIINESNISKRIISELSFLKDHKKHYNVIMPEIPGITVMGKETWNPPDIDQIIDDVNDFIMYKYNLEHEVLEQEVLEQEVLEREVLEDKESIQGNNHTFGRIIDQSKVMFDRINLRGYGIGNLICAAFINKYPQHVDDFYCIEGQIFFNRGLRMRSYTESEIHNRQENILSLPPFSDLYTQYYIVKQLSLDKCYIYDLSDPTNQHIKIHMFHTKTNPRNLIIPQIEYAKKKKIPIKYHIYDDIGESDIMNQRFKKYVELKIREINEKENKFIQ